MDNHFDRHIEVFVFRAVDNTKLGEDYLAGHKSVLIDYGIENITTNNNSWINNPNIYCVVAKDKFSKRLLGGVRIQIADGVHPLPVEKAVGYMDNALFDKVRNYAVNGGISESCGLWIAKEAKGLGLSRYLMWASISSSNQLYFDKMLGICASYTLGLFSDVGFQIDYTLGNKGGFPYPNENYIANVIGILDAKNILGANELDKNIMLNLRDNPIQTRIENHKGGICKVDYHLVYKKVEKVKYYYGKNAI